MEFSWLETRWARPFYLAFVFCLALGLLQAIKLYLRRQRLLRDLRPFPAPPTHWFLGHQKVDGREEGGGRGGGGCGRGAQPAERRRFLPSLGTLRLALAFPARPVALSIIFPCSGELLSRSPTEKGD